MAFAAAIVGGSALIGGGIAAGSAAKQTRALERGSRASIAADERQFERQLEIQQQQQDLSLELTAPRREAETAALNQLRNILGIGESEIDLSGIQIPGQQFAIDEANQGILRQASALGGIQSGNTLAALQERGIGITNQNFLSNFLRPLTTLATGTAGQQAGINALNFGQSVAGQVPSAAGQLQNLGVNRANIIGQGASGVNSAIQGGLSNLLLINALRAPPTGTPDPFSTGIGGF